jgi:hypothetical protein
MNYFEKKTNHKTKRYGSARLFAQILIRVLIIGALAFGVRQGWSCAATAIHNAPVSDIDLRHYQNEHEKQLLDWWMKKQPYPSHEDSVAYARREKELSDSKFVEREIRNVR